MLIQFNPATAEWDSAVRETYQDIGGQWFTVVKYYLNGRQVGTSITPKF